MRSASMIIIVVVLGGVLTYALVFGGLLVVTGLFLIGPYAVIAGVIHVTAGLVAAILLMIILKGFAGHRKQLTRRLPLPDAGPGSRIES